MKELIKLVEKKLDEYLQIVYPEDIFKAMKYTLMLPGKRLRPVMCLETARILGCDINKVLPSACALEMLHVQSLIHDDYRVWITTISEEENRLIIKFLVKQMPFLQGMRF
ncbi:polyprenyl synthetase family protein [bacterium]|nr:polyprenyl synthetase family protein [bacterium]